jgi:hypothetical protein
MGVTSGNQVDASSRHSQEETVVSMPDVSSTVVARVAYDEPSRELCVVFTTGRVYTYHDVPRGRYIQFVNAASKGEFFNRYIRDHYDFQEERQQASNMRVWQPISAADRHRTSR